MDNFINRICTEHDLRVVSVMYCNLANQPFTVFLHWGVCHCASGFGGTVDEALAAACAEMREQRQQVAA